MSVSPAGRDITQRRLLEDQLRQARKREAGMQVITTPFNIDELGRRIQGMITAL